MKLKTLRLTSLILSLAFPAILLAQNFDSPESVAYDKVKDRYLISNPGSSSILQRSATGVLTNFATSDMFYPRGITIVGNILYVADMAKILGYDLTTDTKILDTAIIGAQGLNDIVADDKGNLFMSDDLLNIIYKHNIASDINWEFVTNGITYPNGLYFDKDNNRLLLVSFISNCPVQAISLSDTAITTVVNTTFGLLDGIAKDKNGNFYISSWDSNCIYRFNSNWVYPKMYSKNHDGPADILFNSDKDVLVIPCMNSNKLDFVNISTIGIQDITSSTELVKITGINGKINVSYSLKQNADVSIEVYDLSARQAVNLYSGQEQIGSIEHEFTLNPDQISKGVSFVRLTVNGKSFVQKLVL